jgi:hypothetical protein
MFQTFRLRHPQGALWLMAGVQAAAMLGFHVALRSLVS